MRLVTLSFDWPRRYAGIYVGSLFIGLTFAAWWKRYLRPVLLWGGWAGGCLNLRAGPLTVVWWNPRRVKR